jgi:hypothetical protein
LDLSCASWFTGRGIKGAIFQCCANGRGKTLYRIK